MLLVVMVLVGGFLLGGSALLPARYAPEAVRRFYDHQDRRMVALAAAAAILLGFGVVFYLLG
jgi:ABC-type multidrug transport system permease subunit